MRKGKVRVVKSSSPLSAGRSLLSLSVAVLLLACVPAAGQKKWKQKEKRFEPVVKQAARDYAGRYVGLEDSHWLEVRAEDAERLAVTLYEEGRAVSLRDVRLDGSRLTATKVYEDGRAAPFSAVFADRILNGDRRFGVLVEGVVKLPGGGISERLFYTRR
jgi:hypothetical protein